uniref:B3/B4 tRNA-binding domain-containing protein n=1 Tax=Alexandrium monilatum TaxID=311494 RepID=A0A7S4VYQ0_9DINO|mmetsp:Transcript_38738/g.120515  ORF Transcript_38738/g.120515 Transcript_38738/m.120515 type:complete len:391 (+) Transcript_38738:82-1254(+)
MAAAATPLSFWGLDCGGGLKELDAYLTTNQFIGGKSSASIDDSEVLRHIPAYDLLKYGFKNVHDWKQRVLGSESSINKSATPSVVIKKYSPKNEEYLRKKAEKEKVEEVVYETYAGVLTFSYPSDSIPKELTVKSSCMQFVVEDKVFDILPDIRIVTAVIVGIKNVDSEGKLKGFWTDVCANAKASAQKLQKAKDADASFLHPDLKLWRGYAGRLGVSNDFFPQSVQAMWKRICAGGGFSVSPLVDFYNALSVKHVVTGGGFDLHELPGDVRLRLSTDKDTFLALDATGKPLRVEPGEVSYVAEGMTAAEGSICTRHLAFKQSKKALINNGSEDIFLTFEMPPDMFDRTAPRLIEDLKALPSLFAEGANAKVFIQLVDRKTPRAAFPCAP